MHVISTDYDSDRLNTIKHWNSFTSSFFIDAADVRRTLAERGSLSYAPAEYEPLLKKALHCHMCGAAMPTLPALKSHIESCEG